MQTSISKKMTACKAAAKKRAKMAHGATVVEIDWAKGAKPVLALVKFGSGEIAWVAASCVNKSTERDKEELGPKAAQNYQSSQHNKTNEFKHQEDLKDNCRNLPAVRRPAV